MTDPMTWAAGVLDAVGRFKIRSNPWSVLVYTTGMPQTTCEKLRTILGGVTQPTGPTTERWTWIVAGEDRERVLGKILPYLQTQGEAASTAYQACLTMTGKPVGQSVKQFRRTLDEKETTWQCLCGGIARLDGLTKNIKCGACDATVDVENMNK